MKSLLGTSIILIIATITNPSKQDHIDAIKELLTGSINETIGDELGSADGWEAAGAALGYTLGMGMINTMADSFVHRKNFVVFSLTEISFKGESKIIGIGAFGNVWILPDLEDKFGLDLKDQ